MTTHLIAQPNLSADSLALAKNLMQTQQIGKNVDSLKLNVDTIKSKMTAIQTASYGCSNWGPL